MTPETCETPVPEGSAVTPDENNDEGVDDFVDNNNADMMSGETPREKEIGGRDGPDPTRFGDWEKNGRCIDF